MCNQEFPDLETIYQDYRDQGLVILGLNTGGQGGNESEQTVRAFIEQTLTTFPYAWDQMPNTMNQFAWPGSISPFPRQALVGCDGRAVYINSEYDQSALRNAIESALDAC